MLYNQLKWSACLVWLTGRMFKNVSLCKTERIWAMIKPEDIGPLSLSMVTLKRTLGEWPGNTTLIAGYVSCSPVIYSPAGVASIYLFPKQICFWTAKSKWKGVMQLCNPCAGNQIFYRHPKTCYIEHNLNSVRYNVCYTASYSTFSSYTTCYIENFSPL